MQVVDDADENVHSTILANSSTGGFFVAYMDTSWGGGSNFDVTLRYFDGFGNPVTSFGSGGAVRVNVDAGTLNAQGDIALTHLESGDIAISWNSDLNSGSGGKTDLAIFNTFNGQRLFGFGSSTPGNAASVGEQGRIARWLAALFLLLHLSMTRPAARAEISN